MKILWIDLNSSYAHSSLALPALHAQIMTDPSIDWEIVSATINENAGMIVDEIYHHQPDITKATYRLARGMCKKDSSFVTIISGCDVSDEDAEKVTEMVKAKCPNHVEVSHIRGGQPVYYYMISVE